MVGAELFHCTLEFLMFPVQRRQARIRQCGHFLPV
jgi:hypothetical protein